MRRTTAGEKKARPFGRAASRSAPPGVSSRLPVHARLAPARLAVVRMHMMVGANDRHGGQPNGDSRMGQRGGARCAAAPVRSRAPAWAAELRSPNFVNKFTKRRGAPRRITPRSGPTGGPQKCGSTVLRSSRVRPSSAPAAARSSPPPTLPRRLPLRRPRPQRLRALIPPLRRLEHRPQVLRRLVPLRRPLGRRTKSR